MSAKSRVRPNGSRPAPTFDHLKRKEPRTTREWVPLTEDAGDRWTNAKRDYDRIQITGTPEELEQAKARLEALRDELSDDVVEIIYRALPRHRFEELRRAAKPTSEERVEELRKQWAGQEPEYDAELLATPLIAATVVQPKMTAEQVAELFAAEEDGGMGWSQADYVRMFQQSLMVNQSVRAIDWDFS